LVTERRTVMQGGTLSREIPFDKTSKIAAATMMILSIPLRKADGILIVTGEGEKERVHHGIELWKKGSGKFLLVTGDSEETKESFGEITKKEITDLCKVEENHPDIFKQEKTRHTLDQANWAATVIAEHPIESLIVVSALYHLPRVFLTFLKVLQKNNQKIVLIPCPTLPVSLEYNYHRIPAEIARIIKYQEQGDVATAEELCDYLR